MKRATQFLVIAFSIVIQFVLITSCTKEGPAGKDGIDGRDGASVLSGQGEPTSSVGNLGDYYLDLQLGLLYGPKTSVGWGAFIVKMEGEKGANGSTILSGISFPAIQTGSVGDYYLNTNTYILYGPKTSDGWGTGILLKGEVGNANVRTYVYSDPWKYLNPLPLDNRFGFSLFPSITIGEVTSGSVFIYAETRQMDTLTGRYLNIGAWNLVGTGHGLGMSFSRAPMELSFNIVDNTTNYPAFIVQAEFPNNSLKVKTTNQAKFWSSIKSIKIVYLASSSVVYEKNSPSGIHMY